MGQLQINGFEPFSFNPDMVPEEYSWSETSCSVDEFKEKNFLIIKTSTHTFLICRWSNAIALGDYVTSYIQEDYILDVGWVICPDMLYWFYLDSEMRYESYDDFTWESEAMNIIFKGKLFTPQDENGLKWIVIVDPEKVEDGNLPKENVYEIEKHCREVLLEFFENRFESEGSLDEILGNDYYSEWTMDIFDEFCASHSN